MDKFIEKLSPALFWDCDISIIDSEKNAPYNIERILTMGTWEEFRLLFERYEKTELRQIIVKLSDLDIRTIHFCSAYFQIPLLEFKCYVKKQSKQTHWNY